jgi:phosphoglycolate phosphatase
VSTQSITVRAILFDLDGVLVDSRGPIAGSINHALRAHGLVAEPEEALHALIGDSLGPIFERLLAERDADLALTASCIASYRECYRSASVDGALLFDGIAALLGELARTLRLAVATSKPVEFARPILERVGVAGHFGAICGPPLTRTDGEPKARIAERALSGLGLATGPLGVPPVAAMVGDRHHDVRAGSALGLATVGVLWGIGSEAELREAGALHLVETPAELGRLLLTQARPQARRGAWPA